MLDIGIPYCKSLTLDSIIVGDITSHCQQREEDRMRIHRINILLQLSFSAFFLYTVQYPIFACIPPLGSYTVTVNRNKNLYLSMTRHNGGKLFQRDHGGSEKILWHIKDYIPYGEYYLYGDKYLVRVSQSSLSFYKQGKIVKMYTSNDFSVKPKRVESYSSCGPSYVWHKKIIGFQKNRFVVQMINGITYHFNLEDGSYYK